ncbi:MAG: gliding motility-associated C-terminal domain-containing protein, partial [Paludibacteraceae bacterium]
LTVTPSCTATELRVEGTLPEIQYITPTGQTRTLTRECQITYTDLAWNSGSLQWEDSVAIMDEQPLRLGTYSLPAICKATDIVLTYEPLAEQLGLPQDSAIAHIDTPVAVRSMPTSVTTVRGTAGELCNEVERPTDASVLTGSAPLDILFKANPTPTVEYYEWRIYKATRLIVSRTDEQTRYTFTEPGNYRAVSYVSNNHCPCGDNPEDCQRDSTEISISVSESMLLVPNVFTPNGDGKNDEFRVLYRSIKEYHIWVYNRWGKLVYESTDPAKGWDGTINNHPAAEGAYFYVIRALGTDAAANAEYRTKAAYKRAKDKADESIIGVYQLSGDINLLRGK